MKKRPGLGARLEARFQPTLHWGAEFLANKVRLCAFGDKDGTVAPLITFEGSIPEAEAFARFHGLAFEGMHAAFSHLPIKIEALAAATESVEEDIQPQIERIKPQGLSAEALDAQTFLHGQNRYLVLCRQDTLRTFLEQMPEPLGAFYSLTAAPLALLPFADASRPQGHWAALLAESDYAHLLFFREENLSAYAKVFTGWGDAGRDAPLFAKEMKKALIYHFESRFPGAALDGIQIWRDGPAGEIASALKSLGIPQFTPDWGPLALLPAPFRVAGALALQAMRGDEPSMSFNVSRPVAADSRRLWRKRAGILARSGYLALAGTAVGVALLVASALGLRWIVASKAQTWSGEFARWDEFQKRKTAVEAQFGGMKGLLSHRTDGYAGMQRIAGLFPPELWLESWEMEGSGARSFTHRLEGYSLVEGRVPEFLANLEKTGRFGSVKLKSTERIKGDAVEQKTNIQANRKDLVRFQIGVTE